MDLMTTTTAIGSGLLGTAGLWSYLTLRSNNQHEKSLKELEYNREFNKTLQNQVEVLTGKIEQLLIEKDNLMKDIADLRLDLAEANNKITQHNKIIDRRWKSEKKK